MATVREYFDADFNSAAKLHVRVPVPGASDIETAVLYDFTAHAAFLACYVPGQEYGLDFFSRLVSGLEYGKSNMLLDGKITLPAARIFPGTLRIDNNPGQFSMSAQFFGDPEWISMNGLAATRRVFIYSESQLSDSDLLRLKEFGHSLGHEIQFRSTDHAARRSLQDTPLAFISHDSRDKDAIARKIAINLQKYLCPVWYDEFSLKVGDRLRESIESGLKSCRKCILILSPHFLSNRGWSKAEFDAIFTREIIEEKSLVLPVWFGVTRAEVYEYSLGLANVLGLDWNKLGEEEVCRRLCQAIML